ncbi:MAG: L(+)-tartrate dehydratase subunit beta [Clostridiales bacterium]|jgi:L(+)-tartrate dehydratase beta subunit|nr:L(+)-tartrate dehydratase subunit beta [Clostridiales bacterium]
MKKILVTPVSDADIANIKIGDTVYLTGIVATARDDGHRRVVEGGRLPDFDLRGNAVMHAGPIVKGTRESGFQIIAAGPTTSRRMEMYESEFIEKTGVKIIIGKGGMGEKTASACAEYKTLYCVFPGGCAVSAAAAVEEVIDVEWEDFGMPEAFWILRVGEFGPLIVSIDTNGGNLFEINKRLFEQRKEAAIAEVCKYTDFSHK